MEANGQCHCGKIKFAVRGEPQFQFFCHCEGCRRLNGAGHLSGITFAEEALSVDGDPVCYTYAGGSGEPIELYFCGTCSTQIYARPTHYKGVVVVRANTLDNADEFTPVKSIFAHRAFAWDSPIQKPD